MMEYNVVVQQKKEVRNQKRLSAKLIHELVSADKNDDVQRIDNQFKKIFNNNVEKQHIVLDLYD